MSSITPIPAVFHNGKKTFTVLENNPEVMNALAYKLGLKEDLEFYDIYSLDEPDLSHIPRPVYALLVILPLTSAWDANREEEDAKIGEYTGKGHEEPVIWFTQTIGHACGSIGLLHCLLNDGAKDFIKPDSFLVQLERDVSELGMKERAQHLYNSKDFEDAHQSVAQLGNTVPPSASDGDRLGQHFVAFAKGNDGCLYELEGSRKGPLNRGKLNSDEDVLSPRALDLGLRRVINLEVESGGGDLRFSAIALAKRE